MPKPVLQAMVLADNVYRDIATGKHIIAGTFTAIALQKQDQGESETEAEGSDQPVRKISDPRQMGSPYLYLALVEVHGAVELELKYTDLSDASVLFSGKMTLPADDPVSVAEYVIPVPRLPTNKAGEFSLDAIYEGEILGTWRVSVLQVDVKQSE